MSLVDNFSSFGFLAFACVPAKPNVLKCAAGFFFMLVGYDVSN